MPRFGLALGFGLAAVFSAARASRLRQRSRARSASTSRFFGSPVADSSSSSTLVSRTIFATALSNAFAFAWGGLLYPLTLRTYCSAAA